ncbi:MAG: hypothetical protein AAGD10_10545 [Myxococcota bacterium]
MQTDGSSGLDLHRAYEAGERFRYRLTVTSGMAGGETKTVVSVSSHVVEKEGDAFVERVSWEELRSLTTSEDLTSHARALPAQTFSLDPNWSVDFEPPRDEAMMSAVSDLFTFYVSASRFGGAGNLNSVGDRFLNPELIKGDWSKGMDTKVGRDCLRLSIHLVDLDEAVATLRADYEVPEESCWGPAFDWMSTPIDGVRVNNFEQVKRAGPQWMAVWGYETFTLTMKIDRRTGRIISGEMNSPLDWHGRACMDEGLEQCGDLPPMKYRRVLDLELLDDS